MVPIENEPKMPEGQLEAAFPIPDNLSRKERRFEARYRKLEEKRRAESKDKVKLRVIEEVFDEVDELGELQRHLKQHQQAQHNRQIKYRLYKILNDTGASEEFSRRVFLPGYNKKGKWSQFLREVNTDSLRRNWALINNLEDSINRMPDYEDEEEELLEGQMVSENAPLEEIFRETLRSRQASVELLQMQIAYLSAKREENGRAVKSDNNTIENQHQLTGENVTDIINVDTANVLEGKTEEIQKTIPEPFSLSDWEIFYTTRFWSDNPNHLERLPTDSRDIAVQTLSRLGRTDISVSVGSIIGALEFHLLDKDVIQKALSTRNKYAPNAIRRWVKIKRGKDRIGILIDETVPNRAIFFVGGRDDVYKNLN